MIEKRIAIVTGSGRGIGRAIAEYFVQNNWFVVIATLINQEGLDLENELNQNTINSTFIQTDVSNESSIKNLVSLVNSNFGRIDALVNNAGITKFKSILETTVEDWEEIVNIDLRGVFLTSKYVAEIMIGVGEGGSIINISSNHAIRTLPNSEVYAAAKGGVNAMSRSMALSLGPYGIRVNTVCPGFTDTPHYRAWLSENGNNSNKVEGEISTIHPIGRIAQPGDIASLVYFLSSDASMMITGSEILIDGGLAAALYHSKKF